MVHLSSGSELCEDAVRLNRHVAMMMVSRTHLESPARANSKGNWGIEKLRNGNDTSDFTFQKSFGLHFLHNL